MSEAVFDREPFEVRMAARQSTPLIFNSPHSGRIYPEAFLKQSRLDARRIRKSEDHYVDELFSHAVTAGAPLLVAHFPRAFLDVNREPYELDPKMFDGKLPSYANVGSTRVAGGLGTIPRLVAENMEIYAHRIPVADALARIETLYRSYHACLRRLIARTHVRFGQAVLIDCHSMPASIRTSATGPRPDFIIGDRYGTSASQDFSRAAALFLQNLGYTVTRNKPYAGGFITEHYGRPTHGLHAIQIEVNRGLYFDEEKLEKKPSFDLIHGDLCDFIDAMVALVADQQAVRPLAAE
ncbi:N-formylglutamate amidohydrolase [Pararhizobium haloflavum]|uniref:N-formylglutamate amidohydrolase n=1 Tax=Pararhizobium haloflavum TaxID=2037914 RepID=UPI001FE13E60|nr:N-formylglutamate amidohydrolase [Pararhizobium haloflavum]